MFFVVAHCFVDIQGEETGGGNKNKNKQQKPNKGHIVLIVQIENDVIAV